MVTPGTQVVASGGVIAATEDPKSLVADPHFILATRDTGYRSLANAVAELIDNAIQAHASVVDIFVREEVADDVTAQEGRSVTIAVLDNGEGMDSASLWTALQFGGTGRFGDRSGLGRFGMGLPNSSVSQSRRFEVYSWRLADALFSYLDVDEVAQLTFRGIPAPSRRRLPHWAQALAGPTGTLVVWNRCDRLDFRKASTIAQKLHTPIGRMYRHLIWKGVRISINDQTVAPVDPLFCHPTTLEGGAIAFGSPLVYEVAVPATVGTSMIGIRFTELSVAGWRDLPVEEKRRRGIVGGAGISFVRAGREIDYAWHLMGSKRKENYDDWWRCEVTFDPQLDELFGVTHSKQGVAPTAQLQALLAPDLEATARTLNSRVRAAFASVNHSAPSRAAEDATRQEVLLPPPACGRRPPRPGRGRTYAIRTANLSGPAFFEVADVEGRLTISLNVNHPFFERIYAPARAAQHDQGLYGLECLILAAARAELSVERPAEVQSLRRYRAAWGDALVAFLERSV